MMANEQFEQFKVKWVLAGVTSVLFFILVSCATASTLQSTSQSASQNTFNDTEAPVQTHSLPLNIKTELSSTTVVAGTITLLTLHLPPEQRNKAITGKFEGIELPFFQQSELDDGIYECVVSIPYDHVPGKGIIRVQIGEGEQLSSVEVPFDIIGGNYPSEILRVNGRRVNPTRKSDLIRIKKDQAEVVEIYKRVTRKKYWKGPFILPIQSRVTSPFGTRRVYNGALRNFHPGMDLKAAEKTPIVASAPGEVVLARNLFYTGNTVMIDHGYGIVTLYAHMSKLNVKKGQIIKKRELLGLSGRTGRVNGPHLHWQAVVHKVKVNPLGLIHVIR
jgi:hypothetical protein